MIMAVPVDPPYAEPSIIAPTTTPMPNEHRDRQRVPMAPSPSAQWPSRIAMHGATTRLDHGDVLCDHPGSLRARQDPERAERVQQSTSSRDLAAMVIFVARRNR